MRTPKIHAAAEDRFREAWAALTPARQMAITFGVDPQTIFNTAARLGLPTRPAPVRTRKPAKPKVGRYGPPPKITGPRELEFAKDWRTDMTARRIALKYGVNVQTACSTAARLGLPPKRRHRADLPTGWIVRATCFVCGGDTGGRCGCRLVVAA